VWLFGFPSICECVHNWLDNPINLLCRGNSLFDGVNHFGHITTLLLSFCLFALHFSSNFAAFGTACDFPLVSSPFLPFPGGSEAVGKSLNWWTYS